MAVCIDQIREVANHVADEIVAPALRQTEHGEIRIPVVNLPKAAARHHVRPRQGQQGRIRRRGGAGAGQRVPQPIDVRDDGHVIGRGWRRPRDRGGQRKMRVHKALERLRGIRVRRVVLRQNLIRRGVRHRICECLAVAVNRCGLDRDEQILEQHLGWVGIGRSRRRSRLRRNDRQQGQEKRRDQADSAICPMVHSVGRRAYTPKPRMPA
jgi:hypothetical protein